MKIKVFCLAAVALLMGCTSAEDRAYDNAALPDRIFVATVNLASEEVSPARMMSEAHEYELLILEGHKNPSPCCRYTKNDYLVDKLGLPHTGADIMEVVDDNASLYAITLPDPSDTSLVEPLFGKRMRRHVMTEPQRGCEVVSGVRDGVLRAGVIAHEVPIRRKVRYSKHFKAGYYSRKELDDDAIDNCFISALLLLHGFPESEAMNHEDYVIEVGSRFVNLAPDYKKIADRKAELRAQKKK